MNLCPSCKHRFTEAGAAIFNGCFLIQTEEPKEKTDWLIKNGLWEQFEKFTEDGVGFCPAYEKEDEWRR